MGVGEGASRIRINRELFLSMRCGSVGVVACRRGKEKVEWEGNPWGP